MKKLYRSKKHKLIGGVCGGIAEYFKVDPNVVRIIFALGILLTGFFPLVILYLIAYWLIPEKGDPSVIDGEVV